MAKKEDTKESSKPESSHTRMDDNPTDRLTDGFFTKKQKGSFVHQPVLMAFKDEEELEAVERLAAMGWNIEKGNYSWNEKTRKFTVKGK